MQLCPNFIRPDSYLLYSGSGGDGAALAPDWNRTLVQQDGVIRIHKPISYQLGRGWFDGDGRKQVAPSVF